MQKSIFSLFFLISVLFAQDFSTLAKLLQSSPGYLKEMERIEASSYEKMAQLFNPNYRLSGTVGYAKTDDGAKSGEYAVGAGFDISLQSIAPLLVGLSEWEKIQKEVLLNRARVQLWRLYGNYCIKMEALQAKGELADIYDRVTRLIDKGVRLGEFSASEAIMAHLVQESLNMELIALDNEVRSLEASIKTLVPEFDGTFVCQGLKPNFSKLFLPKSSSLWKLLELNVKNAKINATLYKKIRSLGVEVEFSKEIDTKRGVITLSLPLAISKADESKRLALLKATNSALYELKDFQNSYKNEKEALKSRLELYEKSLAKTERSMRFSADTLIKQSRLRFRAGEENILSILKAIETKISIIENILKLKLDRHNSVADFMSRYAIDVGEVVQ